MAIWRVSKGQSRIVVAIPRLGIAIKCARIRKRYAIDFYRNASRYAREMLPNPDPEVKAMYWEFVRGSFRRSVRLTFRGVSDNWCERNFYKHSDALSRLLLQPTHLSLFGLINVQKYGEPADIGDSEPIYHAFFQIAGQDLIQDGHHWVNAKNFHLATDGPKLLDYGGEATRRIIDQYGVALYTDFDIQTGRRQVEEFRRKRRPS